MRKTRGSARISSDMASRRASRKVISRVGLEERVLMVATGSRASASFRTRWSGIDRRRRNERLDLAEEFRHVDRGGVPDDRSVEPIVLVHDTMAHGFDFGPRYLRQTCLQFLRQTPRG